MKDTALKALVDEIVVPVLAAEGFRHIERPERWLTPEVLLESSNRWFSASWDWRDRYFDAHLGRLFFMKDVWPRVIVRGPMSVVDTSHAGADAEFLRNVLTRIADQLPEILSQFEKLLPKSVELTDQTSSPNKKTRKATRQFAHLLGPELTLERWRELIRRAEKHAR